MTRAILLGAALLTLGVTPGRAQSLAGRIEAVRDGTVRIAYAARPGVCGNGDHNISVHSSGDRRGEWEGECESGPVRVAIDRAGGRTTDIRAYVGGRWRANGRATDLGTVSAPEASKWLLALAEQDERASEDAIFPATLADSIETWPALLRLARNERTSSKARKSAIFWLGQAAGDAATRGLDDIVQDEHGDREVRESAIFALSQRPHDEGVPALIRVARQSKDPKLRRTALFWLGQSEDTAALKLFEELLTKN